MVLFGFGAAVWQASQDRRTLTQIVSVVRVAGRGDLLLDTLGQCGPCRSWPTHSQMSAAETRLGAAGWRQRPRSSREAESGRKLPVRFGAHDPKKRTFVP